MAKPLMVVRMTYRDHIALPFRSSPRKSLDLSALRPKKTDAKRLNFLKPNGSVIAGIVVIGAVAVKVIVVMFSVLK